MKRLTPLENWKKLKKIIEPFKINPYPYLKNPHQLKYYENGRYT